MLTKLPNPQALLLWNKFTSTHPEIVPFSFNPSLFNFYHKHFNWRPYYILLTRNGDLCSLFPLVNTGKAWVSLPHFSYGGFLGEEKHVNYGEFTAVLINRLAKADAGFYTFEISDNINDAGYQTGKIFIRSLNEGGGVQSEKITSIIKLPGTKEAVWELLSPNLKRKINKAGESSIEIRSGKNELLDDFYMVYIRNIRQLNSLNYSRMFFKCKLPQK